MSDNGQENLDAHQKPSIFAGIFLFLLVAGVVVTLNYIKSEEKMLSEPQVVAQTSMNSMSSPDMIEPASGEETNATTANESPEFSFEKASTPRILGNPDAPIKITEHSSYTCPACARFHETNLPLIKRDFIDTGKAYIYYDDFPRNKVDIEVGAIARCIPEDNYFTFINLIFSTQKQWLNEDYVKNVRQSAKLAGASDSMIDKCLGNKELYEVLAAHQQKAMKTFNINGTPTLVINDKTTISGLASYAEIKATLEQALSDMPIDPDTQEPIKEEAPQQ